MIKSMLVSVLLICCLFLASPLTAHAYSVLGSTAQCNNPSAQTGSSAVCAGSDTTSDPVTSKLKDIAHIIAIIAGAAAILLILVSSIEYITSNGDSNKVNSAKNTVIYALVGLIIIVLAAAIIQLVLNKL